MESLLAREARESASAVSAQLRDAGPVLARLGKELAAAPPAFVMMCARGSSDHAATYGAYVLETTTRRLVASVGPSVAPGGALAAESTLAIVVSQSGRSPDVLALADAARAAGARVVGFVNDTASPLAARCDVVVPLGAGPELAIAATKSFLCAAAAFVQLAAAWTGDAALAAAVAALPGHLAAAAALDWEPALAPLARASSAYVLGRGVGLGAAAELALKLKETCGLHAEAFSAAEVLHGPVALVGPGFPVVALGQDDHTAGPARDVIATLVGLGADVASVHAVPGARALPVVAGVPPLVAPLCQVQSAYLALPALARARGRDADRPAHLAKVTETV
jgi:glutamine---fructose-6-phosphate transaminase (isomerizing)